MVAIYVRQSIDKKDSISIESQTEQCKTKLMPDEKYSVYEDRGFSGKNIERPGFMKMINDVKSGKINKVIIYKLDRISRAILDFANMLEIFEKRQVSLVSCNDPIDTTTPVGRAMLSIIMTFAQLERETIQQRIKDNYYARGSQGYYLGGRAPFGYKKIEATLNGKKTYMFEPHENQYKQVINLFTEYANTDSSLGKLAGKFNSTGIKTNFNKAWSSVSVGRLLRNPVYVQADADVYLYLKNKGAIMNNDISEYINGYGCYVYAERKNISTSKFTDLSQSYVTIALHKGLIPPAIWLQCQYKLDSNKQVKNNGKGTHSWLSGLMKCGYCNMAVNVVSNNRGNHYINCGGRKLKTCYERKRVIKIEQIEQIVQEQLIKRIKHINPQKLVSVQKDNVEINRLKIQLVKIEEEINNYIKNIAESNDTVMSYINKNINELDEKKKNIISKIVMLSNGNTIPVCDGLKLDECADNWDRFNLQERKAIAGVFIKKVVVTCNEIQIIFNV